MFMARFARLQARLKLTFYGLGLNCLMNQSTLYFLPSAILFFLNDTYLLIIKALATGSKYLSIRETSLLKKAKLCAQWKIHSDHFRLTLQVCSWD